MIFDVDKLLSLNIFSDSEIQINIYQYSMEGSKKAKLSQLLDKYIDGDYYCEFMYDTFQKQPQNFHLIIHATQLNPPMVYQYIVKSQVLHQYASGNNSRRGIESLYQDLTNVTEKLSNYIRINQNKQLWIKRVKQLIPFQSKSQIIPKFKISDKAVFAYLAYKVIFYICNIDPETFYLNKCTSIRQRILNELFQQQGSLQLSNQEKNFLRRLFDIEKLSVKHQQYHFTPLSRFNIATVTDEFGGRSLIYNPTFATCQIFKEIINSDDGKDQKFIQGTAGIGKSISLSLLAKLTTYIQDYKLDLLDFSQIHHYVDIRFLCKIPRIYYFNLESQCNVLDLIQKIKQSKPKKFDNGLQIHSFLREMAQFYAQFSQPPIFIFDQINLYPSLIRQFRSTEDQQTKNDCQKKLKAIVNIMAEVKYFKKNYTSSSNFQESLLQQDPNFPNILADLNKNSKKRVIYEQKNKQWYGYFEIMNIIQFQIIKEIQGSDVQRYVKQNQILSIKKYFQRIFNSKYCSDIKKNKVKNNDNCYVTHYKINVFFSDQKDPYQFPKFSQDQSQQLIVKDYQDLLQKINMKSIELLKKHYLKFLSKGTPQEKLYKLELVQGFKQKADQYQQNIFFQYKCSSSIKQTTLIDFNMINKEHALIDFKNKTILFFYSAQILLKITDFSQQPLNIIQPYTQGLIFFIKPFVALFGGIIDAIFTTIISTYSVELQLFDSFSPQKTTYPIFNKETKQINFQHFTHGQSNINLDDKLKELTNILYNQEQYNQYFIENQYIAAAPILKRNSEDQQKNRSSQSKAVDCLLVRFIKGGHSDRFELITIDFSAGLQQYNIKKKVQKAQNFFNQLEKSKYEITDKYELKHIFVVRKQIARNFSINQLPQQKKFCRFQVSPIQQLKISPKCKQKISLTGQDQVWRYYQQVKNALK